MLRLIWVALMLASMAGCAALPGPSVPGGEEPTEQQQGYFQDGVVTFAEYEEAMRATIRCVQAQGFKVEIEMASDGFYQYSTVAGRGVDDAFDSCRETWSQQAELAYQGSQQPSEELMPAIRATIECLQDTGNPASDGIRPDQLASFIDRLPRGSPSKACADLIPVP
ncbi:MAG: hypothetical protein ACRDE6_06825 [Candidatus Limnocylindria bacterium]